MQKTDHVYQAYCEVLRRELTAASGCTEPIALAYCAAKARQTLGRMPERVRVQVSVRIEFESLDGVMTAFMFRDYEE